MGINEEKRREILSAPGVEGYGATDQIMVPAYEGMKAITKLRRVGGKLAVYGMVENGTDPYWHIMNPGTYTVPQIAAHPGYGSWGLSYGRALCGKQVVTNGYAADHTPPDGELCARCKHMN